MKKEQQKSELVKRLETIPGLTQTAHRDLEVKVSKTETSHQMYEYKIVFTQMYEYVNLSFDTLLALSEIFQTKKIDIGDRESWGGCETCDYGSRYIVSVRIGNSPVCFED